MSLNPPPGGENGELNHDLKPVSPPRPKIAPSPRLFGKQDDDLIDHIDKKESIPMNQPVKDGARSMSPEEQPKPQPQTPAPVAASDVVELDAPPDAPKAPDTEMASLLDSYMPKSLKIRYGEVIAVPVVSVAPDYVLVDLGDKSEGVIPIDEFRESDGSITVKIGDKIPVVVQGRDEETGQLVVTHRQAREAALLNRIEEIHKSGEPVSGTVTEVVKGGLIVDIGTRAFMPASQIDTSRVEDFARWVGQKIEAQIIDLDMKKRRVVISRRQLLESALKVKREELLASISTGEIVMGAVKTVKDFGAFIEVNGIDTFLPRSEVSWDRDEPSAHLKEGLRIKVKVIDIDRAAGKVTVSRKQAKGDPWELIDRKFPVGDIVQGKVATVSDFGAFIHLEEGITGLLHVTDMHWGAERRKPSDFVAEGQWVKVKILTIDKEKRRLSLGLKQTAGDPWDGASERYAEGKTVTGKVKKISDKGVVLQLEEYIEGFIPMSELSWERRSRAKDIVKDDEEVRAEVIRCEPEKRRIVLSLKSATPNPFDLFRANHPKNSVIEGKVVNIIGGGAFVQLAEGIDGFCPISHLSPERIDKVEDAVTIGETYAFKIIKIEPKDQKISLSRKDYLKAREREEIKQYTGKAGEAMGTNLGDLLKDLDIKQ